MLNLATMRVADTTGVIRRRFSPPSVNGLAGLPKVEKPETAKNTNQKPESKIKNPHENSQPDHSGSAGSSLVLSAQP
jgi:hypothetical protein